MKKRLILVFILVTIGALFYRSNWLIYHKPAFKGQVVDRETNEPIEGAVVVVFYKKETLSPPVEPFISAFHAREALTDREGKFVIPSYVAFIGPISWCYNVEFVIFKPGYVWGEPVDLGDEFSGKGGEGYDAPISWNRNLKLTYQKGGIIKIPKARTDEDRVKSFRSMGLVSNFVTELPIASSIKEKERSYVLTLKY